MLFGPDVCANFLRQEGFELLIRSHEPAHNGYDAFLNEDVPCMQVLTTALPPPLLRYDAFLNEGLPCMQVPTTAPPSPPSPPSGTTGLTAMAICA